MVVILLNDTGISSGKCGEKQAAVGARAFLGSVGIN
jgi:hypothetical protein